MTVKVNVSGEPSQDAKQNVSVSIEPKLSVEINDQNPWLRSMSETNSPESTRSMGQIHGSDAWAKIFN